jgi:hypothetical protein
VLADLPDDDSAFEYLRGVLASVPPDQAVPGLTALVRLRRSSGLDDVLVRRLHECHRRLCTADGHRLLPAVAVAERHAQGVAALASRVVAGLSSNEALYLAVAMTKGRHTQRIEEFALALLDRADAPESIPREETADFRLLFRAALPLSVRRPAAAAKYSAALAARPHAIVPRGLAVPALELHGMVLQALHRIGELAETPVRRHRLQRARTEAAARASR